MRPLLAKHFTATARCKQVLSSTPTIQTGITFNQSRLQHVTQVTGGFLRVSSKRFYSDDNADPSWVRRVTQVPILAPKPTVTALILEPQVSSEEPTVTVKKRKRSPRAPKAKKSDDDSPPFTPPTGTKVAYGIHPCFAQSMK